MPSWFVSNTCEATESMTKTIGNGALVFSSKIMIDRVWPVSEDVENIQHKTRHMFFIIEFMYRSVNIINEKFKGGRNLNVLCPHSPNFSVQIAL